MAVRSSCLSTRSTPGRSKGPHLSTWGAVIGKVVVVLVNSYFLLGMADCGNNNPVPSAPPPTLSALTPSSGTLTPSFASATTAYSLTLTGGSSLTLTPTAGESDTTITVEGTPVTSGTASSALAIPLGTTTVTVALTGTGGGTTSYTIAVTRLATPTLSALSLSAGQLNPPFAPSVTTYDTMFIGNTNVTVTPTATSGTITVNSTPVASSTASGAITLPTGNTTITVAVTGTGGTTTYTITAHRLTQQAYAKASNTGTLDKFGRTVALDGDTLVVGTIGEDSAATGINGNQSDNSASGSGAVYVFTRNGSTWTQQAYIKASNTGAFDEFGASVALSGDTLAVGAIGEDSSATGINGNEADNSASSSGAVYVFTRSGTTWTQQAYVKASDTEAGNLFGWSLALSGDTLAVGATQENSSATGVNGNEANNSATGSGAVYVFTRSGSTWSQQAYVKASNTGANDTFGHSVALSGDTLAVAALGEDSAATGINGNEADNSASASGAAYVFR
ncbi:MAG: cadherin-like beta sandwich domain-containing protein [Nitrospiraceae bacterium]